MLSESAIQIVTFAYSKPSLFTYLVCLLTSGVATDVTREAIDLLPVIFGGRNTEGVAMAVRAFGPLEDPDIIAASLVALVDDVLCAMS